MLCLAIENKLPQEGLANKVFHLLLFLKFGAYE
jgi:hypothetical protein